MSCKAWRSAIPALSCAPSCGRLAHEAERGAVAQLGERCVRNAEVVGSIPIRSTIKSVTYDAPAQCRRVRKWTIGARARTLMGFMFSLLRIAIGAYGGLASTDATLTSWRGLGHQVLRFTALCGRTEHRSSGKSCPTVHIRSPFGRVLSENLNRTCSCSSVNAIDSMCAPSGTRGNTGSSLRSMRFWMSSSIRPG